MKKCGVVGKGANENRWTTGFAHTESLFYLQTMFGSPLSDADLGREDVLLQNGDDDVWWLCCWLLFLGDPVEESPPPPSTLLSCLLQTGWWWREVVTVLVLLYSQFVNIELCILSNT